MFHLLGRFLAEEFDTVDIFQWRSKLNLHNTSDKSIDEHDACRDANAKEAPIEDFDKEVDKYKMDHRCYDQWEHRDTGHLLASRELKPCSRLEMEE